MAKFETIYNTIGPELEDLARINQGKIPKAVFERLIGENFGCSKRTIQSYTGIFQTFGIIRQLNKSWYQFKPLQSSGENDERETIRQVVKA
jgi:hypothetical protein